MAIFSLLPKEDLMSRTRAVIVGGKGFNVPKQVHRFFEVVKHFEQDKADRITGVPECDIILVIRDYVHHGAIQQITAICPGIPIVAARAGWSHLYTELERRKLLPIPITTEQAVEEPEAVPPDPIPVEEQISDEELERLTAPVTPPAQVPLQLVPQTSLNQEPDGEPEEEAEENDDRVETVVELFKATQGEITKEVRELYFQKYGEAIPGPIAGAARRRLGLAQARRREVSVIDRVTENPSLKEALLLYHNVEKLLERRNETLAGIEKLKADLVDVDKNLEIYKPIIQHFEGLKLAQQKVKQALEQKALQDRRMMQA